MEQTVYIYGLCDPRTNELRYVGKTINLQGRFNSHLFEARNRKKCYRDKWIASLLEQDLKPDIFVIEECNESTWSDAERFWIEYFKFIGCRLVNLCPGGIGGTMTPEIRVKISRSNKGLKPSQESIEKRKKTIENRPPTQAELRTRQDITTRWIGSKHKEESKEKIRQSLLGKEHTQERRQHQSEAAKNKDWSVYGKEYIVCSPSGEAFLVKNLSAFCRDHGLNLTRMNIVAHGKQEHHKGWRAILAA